MEYLDTSWRTACMLALVFPIWVVALALAIKDIETKANRFLAAFLFLFGFNLVPQIIGFSGFYQAFPWLTFAPFNNELWLGPLLLAHTCTLLKAPSNTMSKWLFLPGLIQTIYYCVVFTVMPNYKDKWAYNDAVHEPFIMPIELLVGISLTIYCMWKSWLLIRIYQQRLVDVQSSVETFSPMWLKRAITLFSALMILWVVFEMYNQLITPLTYVDQFGFHLLFATIALWSGIQALSHIREPYPSVNWLQASEQADKLDSAVENFDAGTQINEIAGDIPANTANVDTHLIILAERLENELHSKQWFKRSKLSIREMAQELGTNESYVSRALNNHLNKNFNQLVNEARVNYAKQCLIQHPTNNVLDIAFDSGFASKASFNRWFKLCTGQSPSAWQAHKQQANTAA